MLTELEVWIVVFPEVNPDISPCSWLRGLPALHWPEYMGGQSCCLCTSQIQAMYTPAILSAPGLGCRRWCLGR